MLYFFVWTGLTRVEDCSPCLGGYACPMVGMTDVNDTFFCESGFFCKVGANSTAPSQGMCMSLIHNLFRKYKAWLFKTNYVVS